MFEDGRDRSEFTVGIWSHVPLDPYYWRRFDWYASKVTILIIVDAARLRPDLLWTFVSRSKLINLGAPTSQFKALKSLVFDFTPKLPREFFTSEVCLVYLTPTIRHLEVLAEEQCELIQQLGRACQAIPDLSPQSLTFSHFCTSDPESENSCCFDSIVLQSHNWRRLHFNVDDLKDALMLHILSLTSLEKLWIKLSDERGFKGGTPFKENALQSLKTISFNMALEPMNGIFKAMNRAPLRKVSFDNICFGSSYEMQESLELLVHKSFPSIMEELFIRGTDDDDEFARLLPSDLHVLFNYRNLKSLTISWFEFPVEDEDISTFSKSWTNLRFFSLESNSDMNLTLRSLIHLAAHCLYLEELEIAIDTGSIPDLTEVDYGERHSALKTIDLCDSSFGYEDEAWKFIKALFPSVVLAIE